VFLVSLRFIPESRTEGERKTLDVPGIVTVTPALLLLAYGPALAQTQGFSLSTIGVFLLVVVLLLAFLGIEARSSAPLVPLRLFRLRNLNGANLASFLIGASHASMFYFLSLYFQQVLFYHALTASLAILPIAGLLSVLFAARVGQLPAHPTPSSLVPGFQAAFLGAAFFAALGAVLTLLIIRGKRDKSAAHLETQQDVSTGAHEMRVGHH